MGQFRLQGSSPDSYKKKRVSALRGGRARVMYIYLRCFFLFNVGVSLQQKRCEEASQNPKNLYSPGLKRHRGMLQKPELTTESFVKPEVNQNG